MLDFLLLKIFGYFTNSSFSLNCLPLALPPPSAATNNENIHNDNGSSYFWWGGRPLYSCLTSIPQFSIKPLSNDQRLKLGSCPRSHTPSCLLYHLCEEKAATKRLISPLKWIMPPLPYKGEPATVSFHFRCIFSHSNILLLHIMVMDAACLIRYKRMILNELGFKKNISSFGQDLHSHPRNCQLYWL